MTFQEWADKYEKSKLGEDGWEFQEWDEYRVVTACEAAFQAGRKAAGKDIAEAMEEFK